MPDVEAMQSARDSLSPLSTANNETTTGGQQQCGGDDGDRRRCFHDRDPLVISGISGRYPESASVQQFADNLFQGVDMVTDDSRRFPAGIYGLPRRCGKLLELSQFDAAFFGVSPKQADRMDPQLRMLLELTYEAIVDAGMSPQEMRGSRTGVFVGVSLSECDHKWSSESDTLSGYALTGTSRSMFANRISYSFNFTGPSYAMDTACSSSLLAFNNAVSAIRTGECEAAVVGGVNLCLRPESSLFFARLGMLSADGMCKSFDSSGAGYVRAEAASVLLLQRGSQASRVYATVVHSKSNTDGFKEQGITFPSTHLQRRLLNEVYAEAAVDPSQVVYVEAHGTGTKVGDPVEVNAIAEVFCGSKRSAPLLIGSVKSNMGHSEPASGVCSLSKVVIAAQTGVIPANLHYQQPNQDIPALLDGSIKVVASNTAWSGGYVGINSFGFGGANVHVLLHCSVPSPRTAAGVPRLPALLATAAMTGDNVLEGGEANGGVEPDKKTSTTDTSTSSTVMDRLVLASGRTEEAVERMLSPLSQLHRAGGDSAGAAAAASLWRLVVSAHSQHIAGHMYRGHTIAGSQQVHVQRCSSERAPVWFVCSGMGSQWTGMGRQLMQFSVFRAAIARCAEAVRPHGVDLLELIELEDETLVQNTINAFVMIASVQVALIDLLHATGVTADGIVGHSVGELACAYADGCFTAEQTVLCAYWRGRCISETSLPAGAMAAVGLSWSEAAERCPADVWPACHNAADSVTVSGRRDAVLQFVQKLSDEGVFARAVSSSGVAFHTEFIAQAAPALKQKLMQVIPEGKRRSGRWVSSSIPEHKWNCELAQCSSADYHVNNLLSPVLFHEALSHVPGTAVVIEIAPHSLLQAILKRSLPQAPADGAAGGGGVTVISLQKRTVSDNVRHLLQALGSLYESGACVPRVSALYDDVDTMRQGHVACGTPALSYHVGWDHKMTWDVADFSGADGSSSGDVCVDVSLASEQDQYLAGHTIDGRVLYPATGYLVLVWKAMAKRLARDWQQTPVLFSNVSFRRATILSADSQVRLLVSLLDGSGKFEVCEAGNVVVDGCVSACVESTNAFTAAHASLLQQHSDGCADSDSLLEEQVILSSADVYKELRLRGYQYKHLFQGINTVQLPVGRGSVCWHGEWVPFLDTLLQFYIVAQTLPSSCPAGGSSSAAVTRTLSLPTRIQHLAIDPLRHYQTIAGESCGSSGSADNEDDVVTGSPASTDATAATTPVYVDTRLETVATSGVEICGLKASLTSRRPEQRVPLLETYRFVEHYDQKVTDEPLAGVVSVLCDLVCENCVSRGVRMAAFTSASTLDGGASGGQILKQLCERVESQPLMRCDATLVQCIESGSTSGSGGDQTVSAEDQSPVTTITWNIGCDEQQQCPPPPQSISNLHLAVLTASNVTTATAAQHAEQTEPERLCASSLVSQVVECVRADGFVLSFNTPLHSTQQQPVVISVGSDDSHAVRLVLVADKLLESQQVSGRDAVCRLSLYRKLATTTTSTAVPARWLSLDTNQVLTADDISDETAAVDKAANVADFAWLSQLQQLVKWSTETSGRCVISSAASSSGIVGLIKCLRHEPGEHHVRAVFTGCSTSDDAAVRALTQADRRLVELLDLVCVCRRDGRWGSYRHQLVTSPTDGVGEQRPTRHAFINTTQRGDLSTLTWFASDDVHAEASSLCSVHYAPLNFRDIMLATGKLSADALPGNLASKECVLGLEFAGVMCDSGDRVMGLVAARGLATTVAITDPLFVWKVPDTWSLEEAATVPVVYCTAYYALIVRAQLTHGESVLIHSGSGGVGQAAIAIALSMKCTVFTTVGSAAKKQFLLDTFPALNAENICHSRDASFETDVRRRTAGRGVDVVLNSLSDRLLHASVRCLAQHGRFCEIGKFDLSQNSGLGMAVFLKNVTFHGILLDALFENNATSSSQSSSMPGHLSAKQRVSQLLSDGMKSGVVRPLSRSVFTRQQIEQAFRYMAAGKHIGKVLLNLGESEPVSSTSQLSLPPVTTATADSCDSGRIPALVNATHRSYAHPRLSYIITGGLGGFGLELAEWLVNRGATRLILTSRSGVKTGYQAYRLLSWRQRGVQVQVCKQNVSTAEGAELVIQQAESLGPVGGIFNLAMVLRDGLFDNQSEQMFDEVAAAKVTGTIHLDLASRRLTHCHWFVVFSSVSCGRGNAGQTNYGYANSVMERVVEQRNALGLPGLAVQWGAVGDVGVVIESMGDNDTAVGGTLPQRINSCLHTLDRFLAVSGVVSSVVLEERRDGGAPGGSSCSLVATVANILGVKDVSKVDATVTLSDLGLDSLMNVEVKQILERDFNITMESNDIRNLTFASLRQMETDGSNGSGAGTADDAGSSHTSSVRAGSPVTSNGSGGAGDNERASSMFGGVSLFRSADDGSYNTRLIVPSDCVCVISQPPTGTQSADHPLYLVHAIEGSLLPLKDMTSGLKGRVYGIQCSVDCPCDDIASLAQYYLQMIRRTSGEAAFHLAGYSFGAAVAYEMASQLQRSQQSAPLSVTLIEGSPSYVNLLSTQYRNSEAKRSAGQQDDPEVAALEVITVSLVHADLPQLREELLPMKSREQRVRHVTQSLINSARFKHTELVYDMVRSLLLRVMASRTYRPSSLLTADITLIRAEQNTAVASLGQDYGLGKVCCGRVSVQVVPGDHVTCVRNPLAVNVSDIVNRASNNNT